MKPLQMGFFHFVIHIKDSSRSFHGLIVHFFFMLIIFHCLHEIQFIYSFTWGFPGGTSGKEPTCQCRRQKRLWFDPWVRKISWRRVWQPTPVFLPEESHGQRSLAGWLQSLGLQRVRDNWNNLAHTHSFTCRKVKGKVLLAQSFPTL